MASSTLLEVDIYYSFRSPYSYFAAPRLSAWHRQYRNLRVHLRPILPVIVRDPSFFERADPRMLAYHRLDAQRTAQFLNLPYNDSGWADPDPVSVYKDENGVPRVGREQKHMIRLIHLGVVAEEMGRGVEFAEQVGRLIWGVKGWDEKSEDMVEAARMVGLDLEAMDEQVKKDSARLAQVVEQNQEGLKEAGHWGVPVCAFRGEPFFGQDRLEELLWRLKQCGLEGG